MKFIQICGAGRAGKSTTANMIYELAYENNYIPVVLPFAKALKAEAASKGFKKSVDPEGYRSYCQKWGAGRREEDQDYWVKKVHEEVTALKEAELTLLKNKEERYEHLIIQDDVRYMNEIAYGRSVEAYQLFITTADRVIPELLEDWRQHESEELAFRVETGDKEYCDLFHEFVINDGSIEDIQKKVKERFITWISTNEKSDDAYSEMYRAGLVPNEQFLDFDEIRDALLKIDDLLEDLIERLEQDDDEETEDSDT